MIIRVETIKSRQTHFAQPIDDEMNLFKIGCLGFPVTGVTITPGYASLKPGAVIFKPFRLRIRKNRLR